MSNKLGFYLHSSQDQHGLWSLVERIKPPVVLIHMESKDDILLTQMRQFRSPNTFVIGRLGMDGNEQGAFLNDADPEAAGRRLADKIFEKDRSFVQKRFPDNEGGKLLVDAWMSLNEPIEGPSWDGAAQQDAAWHAENREKHRRYDIMQVAFRRRLREHVPGVEAVAFNFGAGNFKQAQQYLDLYPNTLKRVHLSWFSRVRLAGHGGAVDRPPDQDRRRSLPGHHAGHSRPAWRPPQGRHHRSRAGARPSAQRRCRRRRRLADRGRAADAGRLLDVAAVVQRPDAAGQRGAWARASIRSAGPTNGSPSA